MSPLNKVPGFQRSQPGAEWAVWKRLPAVLGWGTELPLKGLAYAADPYPPPGREAQD
jgi:hypothetical protein